MDRKNRKLMKLLFLQTWMFLYVCGSHFQSEEPCNNSLVIAFSRVREIVRYDLESEEATAFTTAINVTNPIAIAADQQEGLVFFTDVSLKKIFRKNFKTPRDVNIIRALSSVSVPDGIAVDPVEKRVFYTDTGEDIIASMDYDGQNHRVLINNRTHLDQPRGIVLDTSQRKMYYTDWGTNKHISRADFSGDNIQVLATSDLDLPNGITADFTNNKIYWCDAGTDTISVMNTDGSNRRTLYTREDTYIDLHFFDIVLRHEDLLISDWSYRAIHRLHKEGGPTLSRLLSSSVARPNGFVEVCVKRATTSAGGLTSTVVSSTSTVVPSTSTAVPSTSTAVPSTSTVPTSKSTPKPTNKSQKGGEKSNTTMIIIGMAIGGSLLAVIIIAVTICCCLKLRGRRTSHTAGAVQYNAGAALVPGFPPPYSIDSSLQKDGYMRYDESAYKHGTSNPSFDLNGREMKGNQPKEATDTGEYLHPLSVQREAGDRESGIYMSILVND